MNRRGSLELSLETLGKLIFYALIIIMTVGMVYGLIQLFVNGEKHYRAERNFNALIARIDEVQDDKLTYPENSLIIDLPENYVVFGFDAKQDKVESADMGYWKAVFQGADQGHIYVQRPKATLGVFGENCKDGRACVCLAVLNGRDEVMSGLVKGKFEVAYSVLECESLDAQQVGGTQQMIAMEVFGPNVKFLAHQKQISGFTNAYDLILNTQAGPRNVQINSKGDAILLDVIQPVETAPAPAPQIINGGAPSGNWK